jgi:hypothetical protein
VVPRRNTEPCLEPLLQNDPAWRDNLVFSEYFHGDNGAAIGAWHQTGWTGLIADVIRRRHGDVRSVGEVVRRIGQEDQLARSTPGGDEKELRDRRETG